MDAWNEESREIAVTLIKMLKNLQLLMYIGKNWLWGIAFDQIVKNIVISVSMSLN